MPYPYNVAGLGLMESSTGSRFHHAVAPRMWTCLPDFLCRCGAYCVSKSQARQWYIHWEVRWGYPEVFGYPFCEATVRYHCLLSSALIDLYFLQSW